METKVPFYNVINIFLPGLILLGLCTFFFWDETKVIAKAITDLKNTGLEVLITVSLFALAYEIGYINFRIGAVLIEKALKKMFGWTDYKYFISACNTSESANYKLNMLSREYGYARTRIMMFNILLVLSGIKTYWWFFGSCILLIILFTLSARGHMKKIQDAITKYLSGNTASKVNTNG